VVSSPACSVSCMRLASSAQRSCGAATNSMRMAALSTTFEPALLKRVNFRSAAASAGPWEILLGRRYRRTRRAAASRGGCPSTADDQGKGEYPLLSTLNI
jgi:hypothetical protein